MQKTLAEVKENQKSLKQTVEFISKQYNGVADEQKRTTKQYKPCKKK